MSKRIRAARRLGGSAGRLAVISAIGVVTAAGAVTTPAFAAGTTATTKAATSANAPTAEVPGDLTGTGVPAFLAPYGTQNLDNPRFGGELRVYPTNAVPFSASSSFQAPGTPGWADYVVTHRGSLTGSRTDDLLALDTVGHQLYLYPNDANYGGTPGHFTNPKHASAIAKPATCAPGSDCTGYDPTWKSTTQLVATDAVLGTDGLPDVVTVEGGKLWYYPGKAGSILGDPVLLGTGDWSNTTIVAPGKIGGTPTLWVVDNTTGQISTRSYGFNADGTPTALLSPVVPGQTELSVRVSPRINPNVAAPVASLGDVNHDGNPGLFVDEPETSGFATYHDDFVFDYPGRPATGGVPQFGERVSLGQASLAWGGVLYAGGSMLPDDVRYGSCAKLTMQADGNLVLTRLATGATLWSSNTGGNPGAIATLDSGGNLVITAPNKTLWSSNTQGTRAVLTVQDDCNLVLRDSFGNGLWASDTSDPALGPAGQLITPGTTLHAGDAVTSAGAKLTMQADGNLVLYSTATGKALWSTVTWGHPGAYAAMQPDGNLVVYDVNNQALWSSGTNGHATTRLIVQDDRNLVLYDRFGAPIWATGTSASGADSRGTSVIVGTHLYGGDSVDAAGARLTMQTDGNLVLYSKTTGKALWSTVTWGHPGAYAAMQPDGNFVVYGPDGKPLWAVEQFVFTHGAHLIVQDDDNLVLYGPDGHALWDSLTSTNGPNRLGTPIAIGDQLFAGTSVNGAGARLDMQADGNLVLYSKTTGRALWSSGTWGHPGAHAVMQRDSNFVVYGPDGTALWSTGTNTSVPGGHLVLQNDNNLVFYAADSGVWSSGTNGQS
ncbi:hypothetical protein ACFZB9_03980 [Kitasatospora sp. NPDC008050]|uniref:hypothetical protein n=1 Tax=Kitasatospora sp. NPDC008050 TaxID=3364021 RepID=UPI0036EABE18